MKVLGLNNREYKLDLKKYIVRPGDVKSRSQYHLLARELINEIYRGYLILEEVKLPGSRCPSKKSTLFIDFLIPNMRCGIEVHGRQHYEYVPFFHKTYAGFLQHQKRDDIKREWCELNNISLIELKYSDSIDEWRRSLELRGIV